MLLQCYIEGQDGMSDFDGNWVVFEKLRVRRLISCINVLGLGFTLNLALVGGNAGLVTQATCVTQSSSGWI